jgi:hypothetical protein
VVSVTGDCAGDRGRGKVSRDVFYFVRPMKSFKIVRKEKTHPVEVSSPSFPSFTISKDSKAFSIFSDMKAGQKVTLCVRCNISDKRESASDDVYRNAVELEVLEGELMRQRSENPHNKTRM